MGKLDINTVNTILAKKGGSHSVIVDNVSYNCTKSMSQEEQMTNLLAGQQGGKKKMSKKTKKSEKTLYREYLDKKYSKEQLLKKCKSLGIKVTTRKNGMLKPIKKETLINKIIKLKYN